MEDGKILNLFFDRSQEGVAAVRDAYGSRLTRLAENITGSWQDAEECVSDALLVAWQEIPPKRPEPLLPWLYRVVRNLALRRYRYNNARKRGGDSFDVAYEEITELLAGDSEPGREVETRELTELIDRFLSKLGGTDKTLFVGRYWHGEAYDAMAVRLGLSEHNCVVRLARVRKKLRAYLEREGVL